MLYSALNTSHSSHCLHIRSIIIPFTRMSSLTGTYSSFKTQLKSHLRCEAFLLYRRSIHSIEDSGAILPEFRSGLMLSWYSLVQPCQVLKHRTISILAGRQFAALSPSVVPLSTYHISPGSKDQSLAQHGASPGPQYQSNGHINSDDTVDIQFESYS